jgi:hypothetical protein
VLAVGKQQRKKKEDVDQFVDAVEFGYQVAGLVARFVASNIFSVSYLSICLYD